MLIIDHYNRQFDTDYIYYNCLRVASLELFGSPDVG